MAGQSLRDRRQTLLERADLRGVAFCRAYAREADDWLSALADAAAGGDSGNLSLLAVGGYGRGELCPFSDLDVVLVHDGRRQVSAVADAIWYPVWDEGVHLDHSVRRAREVLDLAAEDLRVALGLLDGRMVWGDPRVAEPLLAAAAAAWRKSVGLHHLEELHRQTDERHRVQGDVAFLLEPDLKEGHGGLRDVNVLRAVVAAAPELAGYVDVEALDPASAVLTEVRVELHRTAGRALDKLLLQEQDHVAAVLGYPDADDLMAAVSGAGRRIAWVSDDAWRKRRFWQPTPTRALRRTRRRLEQEAHRGQAAVPDGVVERGVALAGGEVTLTSDAPAADDPWLALLVAAVAAEHDLPIAQSALHRLRDVAPPPGAPWTEDGRATLVRVLAAGKPAIDALEALDHHGLVVRLLPEWQTVRNKPQRNAYHRFTVDRHLLEAATNAAALVDRVDRPDLLLVGTLLHDIGKGTPGDHTQVGMAMVGEIGARLGFDAGDVATLVHMVQYHLLLPDVATRRDLGDPATVEAVARAAGDLRTLTLLSALTEADSLATGPSAWGTWKAGLVAALVEATARLLQGQAAAAPLERVTDAHRALMDRAVAEQRLLVELDPPAIAVAAPDRRGLLAAVAGTLALHGLDVRSADVLGERGAALELFTVELVRGRWPDEAQLRGDLERAVAGQLGLEDRLAAKAADYARSQRPATAHPVVPEVYVDNDASASSTVVEVRAADEVGLLHRVTRALFACGLDVVSARVATMGTVVVDAFYVRAPGGTKVTDPGALEAMERALLAAVR